jgi:hypothetical protein
MKDFKEVSTPVQQEQVSDEKYKTFDKFTSQPAEEKYKTFDKFKKEAQTTAPVEEEQKPVTASVKEEQAVIQTISNWSLMGEELMRKLAIGDTINLSIQRNNKNVWTFKEMPK